MCVYMYMCMFNSNKSFNLYVGYFFNLTSFYIYCFYCSFNYSFGVFELFTSDRVSTLFVNAQS